MASLASRRRTKAVAAGRELLPPEQADSWGEFHARLEFEQASLGSPLILVWWGVSGLLFAVMLFSCAYATQDRSRWLWPGMLATLGVLGVMAVRAVRQADRRRARAAELARLQDAWLDHPARPAPPR